MKILQGGNQTVKSEYQHIQEDKMARKVQSKIPVEKDGNIEPLPTVETSFFLCGDHGCLHRTYRTIRRDQ